MARLMAHLIAGYPSWETSLEFGRALVAAGAGYLEVQFPFSDGTADGPMIQEACHAAINSGFTLAGGFELVAALTEHTDVPVAVMTYANLVFQNGVAAFVERCSEAGAAAIIPPDLPPDYDEGLYATAGRAGIDVVPVVAPTIGEDRLRMIASASGAGSGALMYVSLRKGITGSYTEIGADNLRFLEAVRATGARIAAGFGVRSSTQVALLDPLVDYVIVGSLLVETLRDAGAAGAAAAATRAVTDLLGEMPDGAG